MEAKEFIDEGRLVPDGIMLRLISERLSQPDCEAGFILDGYPRTLVQADGLEEAGVKIDAVLSIEVPDEEIERRLTGRRVCGGCGRSYHTKYNTSALEGQCDDCNGVLIRRLDDEPGVVLNRLRIYHESTEPLKGWYESRGLLRTVVSHEQVAVTTERTFAALGILT